MQLARTTLFIGPTLARLVCCNASFDGSPFTKARRRTPQTPTALGQTRASPRARRDGTVSNSRKESCCTPGCSPRHCAAAGLSGRRATQHSRESTTSTAKPLYQLTPLEPFQTPSSIRSSAVGSVRGCPSNTGVQLQRRPTTTLAREALVIGPTLARLVSCNPSLASVLGTCRCALPNYSPTYRASRHDARTGRS